MGRARCSAIDDPGTNFTFRISKAVLGRFAAHARTNRSTAGELMRELVYNCLEEETSERVSVVDHTRSGRHLRHRDTVHHLGEL